MMRTFGRWGLGFSSVVAVVVLSAFAFRDALVTAVAKAMLREQRVECGGLAIDVDWKLSAVRLSPTTCRIEGGRIASVELPNGVDVTLGKLRVASVVAPEITLEVRNAHVPDGAAIALLDTDVTEPMKQALLGIAKLAGREDVPSLRVSELHARMNGRTLTAHDFSTGRDEHGLVMSIASVDAAPIERGRIELGGRLEGISGNATSRAVTIGGHVVVDVDLGPVDLDRSVGFHLIGTALDTSSPRYAMWVERSDAVTRLRTLLAERTARLEARRRSESHAPRGIHVARERRE